MVLGAVIMRKNSNVEGEDKKGSKEKKSGEK